MEVVEAWDRDEDERNEQPQRLPPTRPGWRAAIAPSIDLAPNTSGRWTIRPTTSTAIDAAASRIIATALP
jgi:hypothetical protein